MFPRNTHLALKLLFVRKKVNERMHKGINEYMTESWMCSPLRTFIRICCSLCLQWFSPKLLCGFLPQHFLPFSAQRSPYRRDLHWPPYVNSNDPSRSHLPTLTLLCCFSQHLPPPDILHVCYPTRPASPTRTYIPRERDSFPHCSRLRAMLTRSINLCCKIEKSNSFPPFLLPDLKKQIIVSTL